MGDEVVNDALAIAQHITKFLEDNQAVSYLQAIEKLSIEDWKNCKVLLPSVNRLNRTWKEGHIRDIVEVFRNEEVKTSFLLRDLSLCPGFDRQAVELASFQASTIHCISHVSRVSSRINSHLHTNQPVNTAASTSQHPTPTLNAQDVGTAENTSQQHASDNRHLNTALSSSSNWGETTRIGGKKHTNSPRTWYYGSHTSVNQEKKLPQTSLCLAVKSGCDETVDSLKEELKQWNYGNLEAELVTAADHYTLFRVKFNISTALKDKWKDTHPWLTRMIASLWRGNPTSVPKKSHQRTYRKNVYIGNLSPNTSLDQITNNVQRIYAEEMSANVVEKIETIINQKGTAHTMNKSVCVVLTSHPGKTLKDVSLKLDHYPLSMRRNVRVWRGRPPWPDNHESVKPKINLNW